MLNYDIDKEIQFFLSELENVKTIKSVGDLKIKYLGRKGLINSKITDINFLLCNKKKEQGKLINKFKNIIISKIEEKKNSLILTKPNEIIDITIPGLNESLASEHIITKTINEATNFFLGLGFEILESKEIDHEYYNFDALNIDKKHPSRSENETFYLEKKLLLRTHTSNMQIHTMKSKKPPLKAISFGKVFRKDSDMSHAPMFHQLEGFIVDKNISIANLKFIISAFLNYFFKKKLLINMRSSYFPFTEPSMEVDIQCMSCNGKKCSSCKHSGWMEVLGCGMIHPQVLTNCKIDKDKYTGLAFGLGLERLSMIKYKINDIRLFFENNIEFLSQF